MMVEGMVGNLSISTRNAKQHILAFLACLHNLDLGLGEAIQLIDQGINGLIGGGDVAQEHFLFLRGPGMDKLPKKVDILLYNENRVSSPANSPLIRR